MKKPVTNIAASVHARLLNLSKTNKRPFNELLQYFAMERFLYRVSVSKHSANFILKGGLMLQFWGGAASRATKDIDFHGRTNSEIDEIISTFNECLFIEVEDDGMRFDSESLSGSEIRLDAEYDGVRIVFNGYLGNAKISLQVDVGFGDVITPHAIDVTYPTLLDFEAPQLLGYSPETSIAEKFHAMVILDMANSRSKDFWDVWTIIQNHELSEKSVARAIIATFERRKTKLPTSIPIALTPRFYDDQTKQIQWKAFVRKTRAQGAPEALKDTVLDLEIFFAPIIRMIATEGFDKNLKH